MKKLNILVSAICFVNRFKPGAEIYATFAERQIRNVMVTTPYDYRLITNEPEHFVNVQNEYPERITIVCDKLENEKIMVGPFNQMLKYKTMKDVPLKYDWLWYMDCDAGICEPVDPVKIDETAARWDSQGIDAVGTRTNAILEGELKDHEEKLKIWEAKKAAGEVNQYFTKNLFSDKFIFYNVSSQNGPFEWMKARLPSEHVLFLKNGDKLAKMAYHFQEFNKKFESQPHDKIVTYDMEAFEIGVSALLAGYNMDDFDHVHNHILNVRFNYNNWEKVKY
jgi:hypothetical protein